MLTWIEISDAARATAAAVERARPGQLYNVVDDEPVAFADYVTRLAHTLGHPAPRRLPRRLAQLVAPYATMIANDVRLPVSNAKARHELQWAPQHPNVDHTAELVARQLA